MSDYDPYETNDPYDNDPLRPDPDDDSTPGEDPTEASPEFDPSYELQEPAPAPPRPSSAPTYVAVPCTYCGYNLTGVAIGGNCPECGSKVDNSLYAAGTAPTNGMAITSMVLGIISLVGVCCCGGFLGLLGLIFGIVSLNQIKDGNYANSSRGMALAGIICSIISLALSVLWFGISILGNL